MEQKSYLAIDLKSFYASVECVERGLDPLQTNLVVADESRTDKTICLAVSPALKAWGIPGRPRLFEVKQQVAEINARRRCSAPGGSFTGKSWDAAELAANPALELDFLVAVPQMGHYMDCSAGVYQTYLNYVAPEDIHVYSIDEVFIDAMPYLGTWHCTPRELAMKMIRDVLARTGVTATAGIGTNLYLAKIAMDIVAKHIPADKDGVRIAELDELSYREQLWDHLPLTDFWRIGPGIAKKLASNGMHTMGDIARCSVGKAGDRLNENLLFRLFGVNAELLIDHAWGYEPCTIAAIKAFKPAVNSLSSGQVLFRPYRFEEARLIVREMTDSLILDLIDKGLMTNQIGLGIGYDIENVGKQEGYRGQVERDGYGRTMPKGANGTASLGAYTASTKEILAAMDHLFEQIADPALTIRRITVAANRVLSEQFISARPMQLSLFETPAELEDAESARRREKSRQKTILEIRKRYGKNAIVKGMNLEEAGTAMERNEQVGGHRK